MPEVKRKGIIKTRKPRRRPPDISQIVAGMKQLTTKKIPNKEISSLVLAKLLRQPLTIELADSAVVHEPIFLAVGDEILDGQSGRFSVTDVNAATHVGDRVIASLHTADGSAKPRQLIVRPTHCRVDKLSVIGPELESRHRVEIAVPITTPPGSIHIINVSWNPSL